MHVFFRYFFSASADLGIPIPEMIFGNNFLSIEHKSSGFKLEFKALPALAMVDQSSTSCDLIKVSYAREWFEKRRYFTLSFSWYIYFFLALFPWGSAFLIPAIYRFCSACLGMILAWPTMNISPM